MTTRKWKTTLLTTNNEYNDKCDNDNDDKPEKNVDNDDENVVY